MPRPRNAGQRFGWETVEDAARGWRRVVPSAEPVEILELEVIRYLLDRGVLVIACGGGGVQVGLERWQTAGG